MHRRSYVFSAILHIAIVVLAIFGVPFLMRPPVPDNQPVVVDIVALGNKTNPPPLENSRTRKRHIHTTHPKPLPPAPKPKPKAKPAPKPVPKPQPKPAPKPVPPPPPPPPPPPTPAPRPTPETVPKPKARPKPPAKKVEHKPEVRHRKPLRQDQELESLLHSVEQIKPAPVTKTKPKAKPKPNALDRLLETAQKVQSEDTKARSQQRRVRGSTAANPLEPLSMTEIDMIKAQIYKCWNVPAGAKNAADLVVPIHVRMAPDGTVLSAQIVDTGRESNPFYRAAADSARRAVLLCSPLKMPADKYPLWKDMTLVFNPKDMLGQ